MIRNIVVIRENGRFVMAVNPRTYKATREPQQFRAEPDARGYALQILPKAEWIADPVVINVETLSGVSSEPS